MSQCDEAEKTVAMWMHSGKGLRQEKVEYIYLIAPDYAWQTLQYAGVGVRIVYWLGD